MDTPLANRVNPAPLWEGPPGPQTAQWSRLSNLLVHYPNPAVCLRGEGTGSGEMLSTAERQFWLSMRAIEKRRREWLLGRSLAKQAVRLLLENHLGAEVEPAEIEIVPDGYGCPRALGAWTGKWRVNPPISIAHSDGVAVALAALDSTQLVGIDLEHISRRREDFESIAFRREERQLLAGVQPEGQQEWALRMWCAKEALGKALGRGLSAGLQAFEVTEMETGTGRIQVELRDGALAWFPHLRGNPLIAYTTRDAEFVFATIMCQRGIAS